MTSLSASIDVKERAIGELQRGAESFLTGVMTVSGNPDARPGAKLEIEDAPWPLMGPFLIRSTTHYFTSNNWESEIEFFSDSLPKP